jgi:glutathione S-transferase
MDYVEVEQARTMPGLRLALTGGVPGPWSEAAKAIFNLRQVPFQAVLQMGGEDNRELVQWTGHRNAPVAMYNDEPPRVRWLEIVELAERLGQGPSLIPERFDERFSAIGLTNEIAGEQGFAWYARVLMLDKTVKLQGERAKSSNMFREYSRGIDNLEEAVARVRAITDFLSQQISAQRALGSDYLIGNALSIADVYWACFSQILEPLSHAQCPTPEYLLKFWASVPAALGTFDQALIEQRDFIFTNHLKLPLEF